MRTLTVAAALLVAVTAVAEDAPKERVEISAPLFPKVLELYAKQGANYPATTADREALAKAVSMTFEQLLVACQPDYPGITLQGASDPPLTPEQTTANYNLVAQCSYERFVSKPYWIPQLVDDVDVCGLVLGSPWRLIAEADLDSLSESDYQFLESTLSAASGGNFWGGFYFSLKVFARGKDGKLKAASLAPGVSARVVPAGAGTDGTPLTHLEDGTVLRCIRRAPVVVGG